MQQVEAFKTTDDKIFFDKDLAAMHQMALDSDEEINAFAAQYEINDRTLVGLKKYIPMFLAFKEQRDFSNAMGDMFGDGDAIEGEAEEVAEAA